MNEISNQTLASIVNLNHQVVPVFEKYDLDFCCKGKRMLSDACIEKGLEPHIVVQELEAAMAAGKEKSMPFTEMSAEQLINHILVRHHFYVKQSMPLIYMHLEKVASKHGENYPYMKQVFDLFAEVQEEMTAHLHKEETILFPRIKEMEKWAEKKSNATFPSNYIHGPIAVMENEHEHAGDILFRIRELTSHYTAPKGACTTFKVSLAELKEFEDDLHEHVHLENNILFPKAQQFI